MCVSMTRVEFTLFFVNSGFKYAESEIIGDLLIYEVVMLPLLFVDLC